MKLISLNTQGGKFFGPLSKFIIATQKTPPSYGGDECCDYSLPRKFIELHSENTDIFCFQEVFTTNSSFKQFPEYRANLLAEVSKLLPSFDHFFDPVSKGLDIYTDPVNFDLQYGLAIFVKKAIKVESYKPYFIYKDKVASSIKKDFSDIPVNMQCLDFTKNGKKFTVCNFHGTSFPGSKLDTPQRIEQSRKVKDILKDEQSTKIIAGDFNLLPETKSIKIFGEGMRNLIKEFNIQRTRSKLSPYFGEPDFQKHADYIFVSNDIKVIDFQVLRVEISDHLPMILEFS